ncbi:MAG: spondin domain-containing protein [Nitrospira sp.]|nr:spondin domain-containing protein [Nitrospira sp.]
MKQLLSTIMIGLLMTTGVQASETVFSEEQLYEVTMTNLTRGQQFTPILVASHKKGVSLFTLGASASSQLVTLAEEGNTAPLTSMLLSNPEVKEVVTAGPLLDPGASRTITVQTKGKFDHFSVAAMLIPTNDGFFAINGIEGPKGNKTLTVFSPAYDVGSERNDERCASIPGPFFVECGGSGGGAEVTGGEEGYVHIHAGIHGIGDMNASERDWRNPVAKITIRRIQ